MIHSTELDVAGDGEEGDGVVRLYLSGARYVAEESKLTHTQNDQALFVIR